MFAALHSSLSDTLRRCAVAARLGRPATKSGGPGNTDPATGSARPQTRAPRGPQGATPTALPTRRGAPAVDPAGTAVGCYQVQERFAAGGMCQVYRAQHRHLGYECAMKVPFAPGSAEDQRRMRREAQLGAMIDHPNVVKVLDLGQLPDGRPFLVMELLAGPSLRQVLADGKLAPARACRLAAQVAAGLLALHRQDIVHRDIKPRNLLVVPDAADPHGERLKLIDLGLAKRPGDREDCEVSLPGVVLGTPDYMAPEQLRGEEADARTDQYALGCVLFELLTGQVAADWTSQQRDFGLPGMTPPLAELAQHDLPAGLAELVQRALAEDPAARFPDMQALAQALLPFTR